MAHDHDLYVDRGNNSQTLLLHCGCQDTCSCPLATINDNQTLPVRCGRLRSINQLTHFVPLKIFQLLIFLFITFNFAYILTKIYNIHGKTLEDNVLKVTIV